MMTPTMKPETRGSSGSYKMTNRQTIDVFGGYNHNPRIAEGQFYNTYGLSSDLYPLLCPVKSHKGITYDYYPTARPSSPNTGDVYLDYRDGDIYLMKYDGLRWNQTRKLDKRESVADGLGLIAMDSMVEIVGSKIDSPEAQVWESYGSGVYVTKGLSYGDKTLVSMGDKLCIWPDKKIYEHYKDDNGVERRRLVDMETHNTTGTNNSTRFELYDITSDEPITPATTRPTSPSDGDYWIDTSVTPNELKKYSGYSETWVQVPTTYVRISSTGWINKNIKEGDSITISGADTAVSQFNGDMIVQKTFDTPGTTYTRHNIVVIGLIDATYTQPQGNTLTVERTVPEMSYVCELNNRLWGCSPDGHEIYCCKLGDPTNWRAYGSTASSAYAATIGSPGRFTGITSYMGRVYAFKDRCYHRIYGTDPSNFTIAEVKCEGVKAGCSKSLCQVDGYLYYMSRNGIVRFDGSMPVNVSSEFGEEKYAEAVCGALDRKLYVSCRKRNTLDEYHMFVYDTSSRVWYHESDVRCAAFAYIDGDLRGQELHPAMVDGGVVRSREEWKSVLMNGSERERSEWGFETGDIGLQMPDYKYVSKIMLRIDMLPPPEPTTEDPWTGYDPELDVYVCYDNGLDTTDSDYIHKAHITAEDFGSHLIPIVPVRCDHMRIKVKGKGNFRLYSITKTIEQGSEYNV